MRSLALAPEVAPAPSLLDELEAAFAPLDGRAETEASLAAAGARAHALLAAGGGGPDAAWSAGLTFAADALTELTLESASAPELLSETAAKVAGVLGSSWQATSLELFVRAASNPRLLELPPLLTIELQLRLLLVLGPISEVSIWVDDTDRQLHCLAHAGGPALTRRVREIVRSVLDGETGESERSWLHGVPVLRWQQAHGVLVGRAQPTEGDRTRAFLQEAGR